METVVVTASEGSFPGIVEALREIRAEVQECPLISFIPPSDWAPLDDALSRLSSYGAVAISSPRAAAALAARVELCIPGARFLDSGPAQVWAVGAGTAERLGDVLGPVRTPGSESSGDGAAAALGLAMLEAGTTGRVLFVCGDSRRRELPDILRRNGIQVDEVVCYRSVLASESEARAAAARGIVLVVASPSVAGLLVRACPPGARPDLVAVGPTTASSARHLGWLPAAVAAEPTAAAVAAAVRNVLEKRSSHE